MYLPNTKLIYSLLFGVIIALAGCGGGGSTPSGPTVRQGVFLDSAVEGLAYSSGSQSGITGAGGTFLYEVGATITFMVGDIEIGTANAQSVITPISLVSGAVDEADPTVVNIVQFLLTIDDDGDPDNGIHITAAVTAAATGQNLDFTLSTSAFAQDADVINAIAALTSATTAGTSTLVSEQVAQTHLSDTLLSTMAGTYNGTFSGDASGTWTIEVNANGTISGSGCNVSLQDEFVVTGTVSSSGDSALGFAGTGSFAGNFSLAGEFSGAWSDSGDTGTFSGSRTTGSSSGGTCSGGGQSSPPSPPSGGVGGSVTISGTDTSSIGAVFTPVYDGDSFENSFITSALLYDVNIYTSTLGTDFRMLLMGFSPMDDSPMTVGLTKGTAGSQDAYNYIANCASGDDCSGVSFNRSTMTVTFTNAVLLVDDDAGNLATDNITLNGAVTFSGDWGSTSGTGGGGAAAGTYTVTTISTIGGRTGPEEVYATNFAAAGVPSSANMASAEQIFVDAWSYVGTISDLVVTFTTETESLVVVRYQATVAGISFDITYTYTQN